jgi:hypothetical protein
MCWEGMSLLVPEVSHIELGFSRRGTALDRDPRLITRQTTPLVYSARLKAEE